MEHLEERSHDYIQLTEARQNFFRDLSTMFAIAIGSIVIFWYRYKRLEKPDGTSDYTANID